jgi:hypothetical protein
MRDDIPFRLGRGWASAGPRCEASRGPGLALAGQGVASLGLAGPRLLLNFIGNRRQEGRGREEEGERANLENNGDHRGPPRPTCTFRSRNPRAANALQLGRGVEEPRPTPRPTP